MGSLVKFKKILLGLWSFKYVLNRFRVLFCFVGYIYWVFSVERKIVICYRCRCLLFIYLWVFLYFLVFKYLGGVKGL